jgi:methylphosphotriester-DNA--protein-cysteine methyltransferase
MTDDEKWQAVLTRDPATDAAFVYCVTSTRIYCRPTCASRRPLRANTVYADTPAEAEVLGYRACRRCLPHCVASASEMRQVLAVEQAKVVINESVREGRPAPSLSVLAQHVGMSKFHLQRTFKRLVGHSPDAHGKALAKALRGVHHT